MVKSVADEKEGKFFRLDVSTSFADVYAFDIRITSAIASKILRRMKLFQDVEVLDKDTAALKFWDDSGMFLEQGPEHGRKDGIGMVELQDGQPDRQMVVMADHVYWMAESETVDGSPGMLVTGTVSRENLEKLLPQTRDHSKESP